MHVLCSLIPRLSLPVVGKHEVLVRTCKRIFGDALNICADHVDRPEETRRENAWLLSWVLRVDRFVNKQ